MANLELMGTPVWVYAKDIDTQASVARPKLLQGKMGATYNVQIDNIPNYTVDHIIGNQKGIFDEDIHAVTIYYRKADWLETESLDSKFIEAIEDVTVYDDYAGQVVSKLVRGTVWKVIQRIATKDAHFWYQLADSRWIMYDSKKEKLLINPDQAKMSQQDDEKAWDSEGLDARGIIDYVPNQSVAIYNQPYGTEVARLENHTQVIVSAVIHDPSGVDWYHLVNYGWLNGIYLNLN